MAALDTAPYALARAWDAVRTDPVGRLPIPHFLDRAVWEHGLHAASLEAVRSIASTELGTPWPTAPASLYARYVRDGDRDAYEQRVFSRQQRLTRALVMAATTADTVWIDEVVDGVIALCEQSSWCWPAHDETTARGEGTPDVSAPYVDLGAGEVLSQLAWIDACMGDVLEERAPGLRARVRHEAHERMFAPFLNRRDWHWIGSSDDVHNWNPWIHGNLIAGAIALAPPPTRDAVLALATAGMDIYLEALPADGAIDEGYGYWWNGACRALECLDVLRHVYPRIQLPDTGGVVASIDFPASMHLGGPWFVSFADAQARPPQAAPWHSLFVAGHTWDNPGAAQFAASRVASDAPLATESEGCARFVRSLTDARWHKAAGADAPAHTDVWLPSVQVGVARDTTGAGWSGALKGGHNDENHNHLDVGSCIVAYRGTPVVIDVGRPTYTKATFSADRYSLWCMQDQWHSVPAIAGVAQGLGREFAAHAGTLTGDSRSTRVSVDIAQAYSDSPAATWRRTLEIDHEHALARIDDAWELDSDSPASAWRLMIAGEASATEGGAHIVTLAGDTVALAWPPEYEATWETVALDDPMHSTVWGTSVTRLTVTIPHHTRSARLTATLRGIS